MTEANATGIWRYGDTGEAVQVARTGDILDGRTLRGLSYYAREGLTNFGQLGIQAESTDDTEALLLYTPDMVWRSPGVGAWHDRSNWTFGLPDLGGAEWEVLQTATLFSLSVHGDAGSGGPGIGVIPLPAGGWLLLSAFGALALIRRRRPG